jgi:hypothetical protein
MNSVFKSFIVRINPHPLPLFAMICYHLMSFAIFAINRHQSKKNKKAPLLLRVLLKDEQLINRRLKRLRYVMRQAKGRIVFPLLEEHLDGWSGGEGFGRRLTKSKT